MSGNNGPEAGLDSQSAQRPWLHHTRARSGNRGCSAAVESRRQATLLFFLVILGFHVLRFGRAVGEGHVLQLALAASVAHGAVEGCCQQHFDHRLCGLFHFFAARDHSHASLITGGARQFAA